MVRISVQPELQAEWRPVLERQLNLALGRMRGQLSSLRGHFDASPAPDGETLAYRCELRSRTARGHVYRDTARSPDGSTAVTDALACIWQAIEHARHRRELERGRPIA
jgi:hypothetical protein